MQSTHTFDPFVNERQPNVSTSYLSQQPDLIDPYKEADDSSFKLNIPHRSEIAQQQEHLQSIQRASVLFKQKALVEEGFEKLKDGQTSIEFDTEETLLPEITTELTRKGYNYYYRYNYNSDTPDSNGCHVVISTRSKLRTIDNFHHNQTLYNWTRDFDESFHKFNSMLVNFCERPSFF